MSTIPNTIQCRINILNHTKEWLKNHPNAHPRQRAAHQRLVDHYTQRLTKLGYKV